MLRALLTCSVGLTVGLTVVLAVATTDRVLVLNDLHLNPWYSADRGKACHCLNFSAPATCGEPVGPHAALAQFGCDTTPALLNLALAAAATLCPDPQLVLVLGDSSAHRMNAYQKAYGLSNDTVRAAILGVIGQVTTAIASQFPGKQTLYTVGNDDTYPDYMVASAGYLADLLGLWNVSFAGIPNSTGARASFLATGHYLADTPAGVAVIVLSTNVFAPSADADSDACAPASPARQALAWLNATLQDLSRRGRKAWICGHIPPGFDSFSLSQQWRNCYSTIYLALIQEHSDVVAEQLFAHEHRALLQGVAGPAAVPLRVHPAVSPVYDNNPGFRCYTVSSPAGAVTDYVDFYLNLSDPATPEFKPLFASANTEYDGVSAAANFAFVQSMRRSMALFARYGFNSALGTHAYACATANATQLTQCAQTALCTLVALTAAEFAVCNATGSALSAGFGAVDAAFLAVGVVALVALTVVVVYKSRQHWRRARRNVASLYEPLAPPFESAALSDYIPA